MIDALCRALESAHARALANIGLVAVAVAMILTIVLPATLWRAPQFDASYSGFDPVVMYHDAAGASGTAGNISITPAELTLSALPGSAPIVHLSTGPLSSTSSFDATIVEAQDGTQPLVVALWSPYRDYRYQLTFESEPSRTVQMQRVHQGTVFEQVPLGVYAIGQSYSIETTIDRQAEVAEIRIRSAEGDTFPDSALYLETTNSPFESHAISSQFEISPGVAYTLQSAIKPLASGLAGQSVEWLDAMGQRISIESQWQPLGDALAGWAGRELSVIAPAGAEGARIELATASDGAALFGDIRFSPTGERELNLLANGSFTAGPDGWQRSDGTAPLEVRHFTEEQFVGTVSAASWPELFESARMALSVSAASSSGFSTVHLRDYQVDLPHQRWLASKVADLALYKIVAVLGLTALFIGSLWAVLNSSVLMWRARRAARSWRRPLVIRSPGRLMLIAGLIAVFAIGNALLSHVGSLNADLIAARVWGYVSATHGPADLYFLSNLSSATATQWNGLPLQEAGYPYGPIMAYVTWVQGMLYALFLAPVVGLATGIEFDSLTRATNAVFAVADAGVILLILRRMGAGTKASGVIAGLFLFNPAVWFAGSVWGTSQSVSLLFLLLAIWSTQREKLGLAWGLLFLAMMTRPQNLIPGGLLAIYLLREYPLRGSLMAISKATIATFLLLIPLSLAISPTLPVDTIVNALFLHVGSGNDEWTRPLSWGGMSIWPLAAPMFSTVEGVDRVLFPATVPIVGSLTPYRLGNVALVIFLGALAAGLVRRSDPAIRKRDFPLVLALGAMALFMLPTGVPTYHFVLALALIMLTYRSLPRWAFVASASIVTITTLLSMYTMGAYWLSVHPTWGIGVYDPASPFTTLAVDLVLTDAFVTSLVIANLFVFLVLCRYAIWPMRTTESEPLPDDRGVDAGRRLPSAGAPIGLGAASTATE